MWYSLFLAFLLIGFIRLIFYFALTQKLHFYFENKNPIFSSNEGVSIIITAKNEANNLRVLLPKLLKQRFALFEIIVIDDFSSDETWSVINSFHDKRLKALKATKDLPGKKHALQEGIDIASHDLLLFTDADCKPSSHEWVEEMAKEATKHDIVLGYSPMIKVNRLVSYLSRFETAHTALFYLSAALLGHTYMGVGRNTLYRKSLFQTNNGFKDHLHVISGDDDLQIQKMASNQNMGISISSKSWMYTQPKENFTSYLKQKIRHIGVANHYQWKFKISLGLVAALHWLFYTLLFVNFLYAFQLTLWIYLFWVACMFFLLFPISKRLGEPLMYIGFPLFDMCFLFLNVLFLIYGKICKKGW